MNSYHFSGWLSRPPERRWKDASTEVLVFAANVKDEDGNENEFYFRVDDQAIVSRCADVLTMGRAVFGRGELRRVPVEKRGVHVTDRITCYVRELEVPNRSKPHEDTKEAAVPNSSQEAAA